MVIKTFSDRSQYRQTVRLLRVMSVLITELYDIVVRGACFSDVV